MVFRGVNISNLHKEGGGSYSRFSTRGHVLQTLINGGRRTHSVSTLLLVFETQYSTNSALVSFFRIMVLDKGQICEFDTPQNLLGLESSMLYSMAKDAGLV